jgi:hypothetical protein
MRLTAGRSTVQVRLLGPLVVYHETPVGHEIDPTWLPDARALVKRVTERPH